MPDPAKTLPDPLQSASLDPGPNADEILSQLAGEEIDRLLAEADAPRSQIAAPAATTRSTESVQPPPRAATSEAPADSDLSRQLDDLFNELNQEITVSPAAQPETPQTPPPEIAPQTQVEPPRPATIKASRMAAADPAQDTGSLQEDVLAATSLAAIRDIPADPPESPRPAAGEALPVKETLVSSLLRPVAWLNNLFPEAALDWMGKAAILTTINAIAIFAYLLIRRH